MAERRTTAANDDPEKQLSEQVEQLKKDVLELTESLKALGHSKAEDLKTGVKDKASDLAAAGRSKAEELSQSAANLESDVTNYVREKPLQSLAIAAVVGVVLGLMSRRG